MRIFYFQGNLSQLKFQAAFGAQNFLDFEEFYICCFCALKYYVIERDFRLSLEIIHMFQFSDEVKEFPVLAIFG